MIDIMGVKYMTDKEASKRYGYSTSWFQKQRSLKQQPSFIKLLGKGKVYYPLGETDMWFKDNMKLCDE